MIQYVLSKRKKFFGRFSPQFFSGVGELCVSPILIPRFAAFFFCRKVLQNAFNGIDYSVKQKLCPPPKPPKGGEKLKKFLKFFDFF